MNMLKFLKIIMVLQKNVDETIITNDIIFDIDCREQNNCQDSKT